jgi:MoxR-like ATPase
MMTKKEILEFLNTAHTIKPDDFIVDDLKWRYLLWAALKGKNVLLLGPTRCGKTKAVQSVVKALKKEDRFFYFNLGSTQDARATLIGNTYAKKDIGTVMCKSEFVTAITTPNAIILLDEITRGHHDAWNILMSVIDPTQRYLRLDEAENSDIIHVAKGVTFFATANIGTEYTSTKSLDKALSARFPVKIEMEPLAKDDEYKLLKYINPNADENELSVFVSICEIAEHTRKQMKKDDTKISTFIPTGSVIEMAELVIDGFDLKEIAEVAIYPDYPTDEGTASERTYMKQLVQKYITDAITRKSPLNDPLDNDPDNVPF